MVLQFTSLFIDHVNFSDFIDLPSLMYGQTTQLPHFFIPLRIRFGLVFGLCIFALTKLSLIFLFLLYAIIGGSLNTCEPLISNVLALSAKKIQKFALFQQV